MSDKSRFLLKARKNCGFGRNFTRVNRALQSAQALTPAQEHTPKHPTTTQNTALNGEARDTAKVTEQAEPKAGPEPKAGAEPKAGPKSAEKREKKHPWWQVMCLSGVDYFSTLGYQPGIAVIAAGVLAPIATIILVAVTLLGAVPVYRRVAALSPNGFGSIALAEKLTSGWTGKLMILVLLGFAATDFLITITLSSADAAAHVLRTDESPWQISVTLAMILALTAVFFRGFREAVSVAMVLVGAFLTLTSVVVVEGLYRLATEPGHFEAWTTRLGQEHASPLMMLALAIIVFPKLALGLSGFETGVSVMPLIRGDAVKNGRRLIITSASIMSLFLITSSVVVTMLIPAAEFGPGGTASGRALAWLAHHDLGPIFGAAYDLVTIGILWFAGASAMAGILALIPRYLPRFGMAPEWASKYRPMVAVLSLIAIVVTLVFHADVERQSGAYATGVLVVLASGAISVTLMSQHFARWAYGLTALILSLTLFANIIERPDGLKVASFFILAIIALSFASRTWRSFEMRKNPVTFDSRAEHIIRTNATGSRFIIVPTAPGRDLEAKERRIRQSHRLSADSFVFLEISLRDPSMFRVPLHVKGAASGPDGGSILRVTAASIPNAVAVISLEIQKLTGITPDIYFEWAPGSPLRDMVRFIFTGRGQNATVTREMLRRGVKDEHRRPTIYVS